MQRLGKRRADQCLRRLQQVTPAGGRFEEGTCYVGRLLVVGGAATLKLPDGSRLLDSPSFPPEYRATAEGAAAALQILQQQSAVSWSFLSPAAQIFPGGKTGRFRLGLDNLLTDAAGKSRISTGDYAVAMLEEAEQPQHVNQRFSIAY